MGQHEVMVVGFSLQSKYPNIDPDPAVYMVVFIFLKLSDKHEQVVPQTASAFTQQ